MDTREIILAAALTVLEEGGEAQFSTRAVCSAANVTAPTLYHHFGSADGLLSAAIEEAFRQFLESKKAAVSAPDPQTALRQGWDDYVRFAAKRPRLYCAMMARFLTGATRPAAEQCTALLKQRIADIAEAGQLAMTVDAAADLMFASVNAASLLVVTALQRKARRPSAAVTESLREQAMRAILHAHPVARKAKAK